MIYEGVEEQICHIRDQFIHIQTINLVRSGGFKVVVSQLHNPSTSDSYHLVGVAQFSFWPVLLTGSNESSGRDPLRQFPVILSSASV